MSIPRPNSYRKFLILSAKQEWWAGWWAKIRSKHEKTRPIVFKNQRQKVMRRICISIQTFLLVRRFASIHKILFDSPFSPFPQLDPKDLRACFQSPFIRFLLVRKWSIYCRAITHLFDNLISFYLAHQIWVALSLWQGQICVNLLILGK